MVGNDPSDGGRSADPARGGDAGALDREAGADGDDAGAATTPRVRVRGIYATGLTERLREDCEVVQASAPIRRRFDGDFPDVPADVSVDTTPDRQGLGVTGTPRAVETVADLVTGVGRDALSWMDSAPVGAVFDARVVETLGGGAVLDLGDRQGYLPYDAAEGYVEGGDDLRVQVREGAAPWSDDRPELATEVAVGGTVVTLSRGRSGVSAAMGGERATELVRTTDLLSVERPDGWGVRWEYGATDAGMDALEAALEEATAAAHELEDALDGDGVTDEDSADRPRKLAAPRATRWVWFGRESRFALDSDRRTVARTMAGHHRIKAAHESASAAVDLVEAVCGDSAGNDVDFPFAAVVDGFGPREGDRLAIGHGKPEGQRITLGRGEVTDVDPEGRVTVRRTMSPGGNYDALGVPRERGDVAITKLTEGRWWYPTVYRGEDGQRKGTYVNICTPVEIFPDTARYVDLHVDVVKHADGTVVRVDDDELDEAVEAGHVPEPLAEKARAVASAVENALE